MTLNAIYHLQTEAQFMAQVVRLAKLFGWRVYHTRNSKGSEAGFPDLILVRRPRTDDEEARVLVVELKAERGRLTDAQRAWLAELQDCGLDTRVWRPHEWKHIEETLR